MSGEARLPVAVILACLAIVMTTCFVEAAAMSNSSGAIGKEDEDGESEHAVIVASLSWQSHHLNGQLVFLLIRDHPSNPPSRVSNISETAWD
mgnify:CR=1 FL=1